VAGDWWIVTGTLAPEAESGAFGVLRRADSVACATAPEPGGFTFELRAGAERTACVAPEGCPASPLCR
jgi:hypothetical protein